MSDEDASDAAPGAAAPEPHPRIAALEAEKAELQRRHDLIVAEREELRQKLDAARAEHDSHRTQAGAEKAGLEQQLRAANAERDAHRATLDAVTAERDRLSAEAAAAASWLAEAKKRVEEAAVESKNAIEAAAAEAKKKVAEAMAETERVRAEFESRPAPDALALLADQAGAKLKAGIAWVRTKIPESHPALPWFDSAVDNGTKLGCFAVRSGCAFVTWATPHAKELAARAQSEIAARIAKK